MSTNTSHDDIVVFREEASASHVFHLLAAQAHDQTKCGRVVDVTGARLPRYVADVAGFHLCESCRRLQHAYGEAGALMQEPTAS